MMSVWPLLTVSWHQDNLVRRQILHDEPSLYRGPGPGRGRTGTRETDGDLLNCDSYENYERRSDIKTGNCYTLVIITSEVNIPSPDPGHTAPSVPTVLR